MRFDSSRVESAWPHVVILGAGLAGLQAAKALAGQPPRVTVIDGGNLHGGRADFADRLRSALRSGFGGHEERRP
jgi:predicted NAD/FAD-dependent oxidoreductase